MAGIIQISGTTGYTWYAFIWNADGKVWNGSSFVTYSIGSWSDYVVDLTEKSSTGYYEADFPSGIVTAGKYHVTVYQMEGVSPTAGDPVVGQENIDWTGSDIEQGLWSIVKNKSLSELAASQPSATPTLEQAIMFLYMALRNKQVTTTSETKLYNSAGNVITKAILTYDGKTTITREGFGEP